MWPQDQGQLIWEGQPTPNINGEEKFLRGAQIENALHVEDDEVRNKNSDSVPVIGKVFKFIVFIW